MAYQGIEGESNNNTLYTFPISILVYTKCVSYSPNVPYTNDEI